MLQALKTRIKQAFRLATGRMPYLRPVVRVEKAWFGNDYGGFYVCPKFLNADSIVYSVGVGEDVSFDLGVIGRFGCSVFAFDPTPKSIAWVKGRALPGKFSFHPVGIGNETQEAQFFLPKNPEHVSGSFVNQGNVDAGRAVTVQLQSFPDMMAALGHAQVDVLKMDIEGGEYAVLDSILRCKNLPGQLLIEFHDRFFDEGEQKTIDAIARLDAQGYRLFAVSPTFEEVSFIRADLLRH